jgi:serine protease Do
VLEVDPDGKAAELSIAAGDVILSASGKSLSSPEELVRILGEAGSTGKGHSLLLVRHDKTERYVAVPVAVG